MISIYPLLILVEIFKAWKKEIYAGSIPVGPAGTTTSKYEIIPTLAGAETLFDSTIYLILKIGHFSEKMSPNFPLKTSLKADNSGIFPPFLLASSHSFPSGKPSILY